MPYSEFLPFQQRAYLRRLEQQGVLVVASTKRLLQYAAEMRLPPQADCVVCEISHWYAICKQGDPLKSPMGVDWPGFEVSRISHSLGHSIEIAWALHKKGKKPMLIDDDPSRPD